MSARKSPKIHKLVVNAIRRLQDVEGCTPREISNYISQEYDVPKMKIQRQVKLALARAVSYGILQRSKGGHYACNRDIGISEPLLEEGQLTEKCGGRRGRGIRVKRGRSRKSRRRKSGAMGCKRRGKRRGRSSRKRSRSGKSSRRVRRRRGGCGGGSSRRKRKSRSSRRRRGGCASMKSRRRASRSGKPAKRRRSGRSGKKCPPTAVGAPENDDFQVSSGRGGSRGRARSVSATRNENRSLSSGSFEEEDRINHEQHEDIRPNDSPEVLLD